MKLAKIIQTRHVRDRATCAEVPRSYGWMTFKGRVVLDIGLHIGSFSRYALEMGAKRVIGFEPAFSNYKLAIKNCDDPRAQLVNSAVVPGDETEVPFYMSTSGKTGGNYSTVKYRGRNEIRVSAVNFQDILKEHRPSVLKIDCEGAEYDLLIAPLPKFIKEVTIELHLNRRAWRKTSAPKLLELFPRSEWETIKVPKLSGKSWTTIAGFRRKEK